MKKNAKNAILNSAIELFTKKGYSATTTSEIAMNAGYSEGTIYRHFKSKKDILVAATDMFIDDFSDHLVIEPLKNIVEGSSDLKVEEVLKQIIVDRYNIISKNSDIVLIMISELRYDEELKHKILSEVSLKAKGLLCEVFKHGIQTKQIKDIDIELLYNSFIGLVIMNFIVLYNTNNKVSNIQIENKADEVINLFLDGVRA